MRQNVVEEPRVSEDPDVLMKSVTRAGPRSVMDHSHLSAHLTLSLNTALVLLYLPHTCTCTVGLESGGMC